MSISFIIIIHNTPKFKLFETNDLTANIQIISILVCYMRNEDMWK